MDRGYKYQPRIDRIEMRRFADLSSASLVLLSVRSMFCNFLGFGFLSCPSRTGLRLRGVVVQVSVTVSMQREMLTGFSSSSWILTSQTWELLPLCIGVAIAVTVPELLGRT